MKTRRDYEVELMQETIPGCSNTADENMSAHLVHTMKWLMDSLIDARMEIDNLKSQSSPERG